ncbi:MAG: isopenicillin N synthase family dioxygenase [Acidimicrobiales bacterium]
MDSTDDSTEEGADASTADRLEECAEVGTAAFSEIPVISLAPLFATGPNAAAEQAELAERLCQICHEIGFFLVVDHEIPIELTHAVFDMMERFFSLPVEQKMLIDKQASRHFRGWEPVGTEFTNNRPDIREQIDMWTERPALPPAAEPTYMRLLGPNQWLEDDVLSGHRELSMAWFEALGDLADRLLSSLSVGMGLEADHMQRFFGQQSMSLAKFIHYPPTPAGQAGVNGHHDAGFLTVLAPGPTPGLQVQNQDEQWIDVPSVENAFVINLGEMLQGVTGNYLVATPHRVITGEERYSTGYFHGPSLDTPLAALPLDNRFAEAVAASPHHSSAGFMARKHETESGIGDMRSDHKPDTYGEQLWNYFTRSYPSIMERHYGS